MKEKGFTLVELLTTIFIIGIVLSIGGYVVSGVISNSEEKSVAVTLENVKKSANAYAKEYYDSIAWKEYKGCVSIEELISKGFLKKDILEKVDSKYIVLTRDEYKNILSEEEDDGTFCSTINNKTADPPKSSELCNSSLEYTGDEQYLLNKYKFEEIYKYYNTDLERMETNAGTYKIRIGLNEGYQWKDNSAGDKVIECTINKIVPKLSLSSRIQKSTKIGQTTTTLKSNIKGNISIKTSNPDYATATTNGVFEEIDEEPYKYSNLITINNLASRDANTYITITLSPEDTANYQATSVIYTIGEIPKDGIPIPDESYCTNVTYNGESQSLIDETILEENGGYAIEIIEPESGKATETGEYTIKFKLKNAADAEESEKFKWDVDSSNKEFAGTDKIYDGLTCEIKPLRVTISYNGNGNTSQTYTSSSACDEFGLCGLARYGEEAKFENNIFKYPKEGYDITKDDDGDGEIGANITLIENNFERTGYTFVGWNTKANGSGTNYSNKAEINNLYYAGEYKLYAKWQGNTYKVAYNCNGGSNAPATSTHIYGTASNLSANTCTKTGYTFNGWNTESDESGTSYSNKASIKTLATSGTVTLYAKWKVNTYKVHYYGNNSTSETYTSSTSCNDAGKCGLARYTTGSTYDKTNKIFKHATAHEYDESFNLAYNRFKRTGYTFNGWNTKSDGSGTNYANQASVNKLTATNDGIVKLYAKWKANTYNVSYNCNGGSNAPATSTHTYGTASNLRANTCTRTGYTFNGWNTKKDGSGTSYSDKASVKTLATSGTVTLYAKWKANTYKIVYKGNGSTSGSTATSTHTYNVAKALTSNGFKRTGYTFIGWATSSGGSVKYSNKQSVKNLATSGTVTLYAKWSDKTNPTCKVTKTTSGWKSSGVGVKITCSDSGSGCATATRTATLKSSKTYYVYDNAGNKGSCSVSISSRKAYSKSTRKYNSCQTTLYKCSGKCYIYAAADKYVSTSSSYTVSVSGYISKSTANTACLNKCKNAGNTIRSCSCSSYCKAGYTAWSSYSSYTYTSCTASSTTRCKGPQTQYK